MNTSSTPTAPLHETPPEIATLLTSSPELSEAWNKLTPLARNEWICYVTIFKKPETRQQHLERLQADLLDGKKRPCCWPGCPHRRPSAQKWFGAKK